MITKKQTEVLNFITEYTKEHGFAPSYRETANALGLTSPSTIHAHIQALIQKGILRTDEDGSVARAIEVVGAENAFGNKAARSVMLPLAGLITAGEPIEAVEEQDTIAVPADFIMDESNSYVLKVKGRSMIEDGILDGDFVVIERNPSPRNGDVVVALLDNAFATLKRFYREPNFIRLQPANSLMKPIIINGDINIQGVVRAVIRKFA